MCWLHVHVEDEKTALAIPIRLYNDTATARIYNLLNDGQAETNALTIDFSCAMQFAEFWEELGDIFRIYSDSTILNVDNKALHSLIIRCLYHNHARVREL